MDSKKVIPNYSYYLPLKQIIKYKNPFIHGTLLIKKEVLDEIGGYDNRFRYSQDYKLMTDLLNSGYKALMIKEPLYYLNMNNNISNNYKKSYLPPMSYVNRLKKRFSPYCSVATWYLWRSIDDEPIQY